MDELKATLKVLMANQFVMYFKAHSYHWNVEGINFNEYHEFFAEIYSDVYAQVDPVAEYLRVLGEYAPLSVMQLYEYKSINEDTFKPSTVMGMLGNLSKDNQELIANLNKLFDVASAANEQGMADYAASRLDKHKKHAWMIRSCLKTED